MKKPPREIELKLEVPPDAQEPLKKAPAPNGFTSTRATTKTLHSIYFDTPDQALRSAKISLRVRKVGQSWIQTAKFGTGVTGGLSSPVEVEQPVNGRAVDLSIIDDPQILKHLVETIDGNTLAETFETIIRRTSRELTSTDGSRIEVAFDTGEIKADGKTSPLAEVEFELLEGSSANLYAAASELLGATPFRFSPCSKAERGFRLAGDEGASGILPALASKVMLSTDESVEHAFRSVLRSCLTQIADNRMAVLTSDLPEGPHQLRIGLRRLRSAFHLFKPALNPHSLAPLNKMAKEIGARVGALRDLDVLAGEIVAPLDHFRPDTLSLEPLLKHLGTTREACREDLIDYLETEEINVFLFGLAAYTEGRGWLDVENFDQSRLLAASVSAHADRALDRHWKTCAKYGSRIDELEIAERHEMRKTLKKLRYGIEFFGSLYPKRAVKPFLKRLKNLQDIFGYLNDVTMAEKLLGIPIGKGAGATGVAQAIGFTVGWHEAQSHHMWHYAKGYWADTRTVPKFWR